MKPILLLLALALPAAAAPPTLPELARQIEQFPAQKSGTDSERLAKFFDLYWTTQLREQPSLAAYIGRSEFVDHLEDFSPEVLALEHRLSHLELAALASIDRARLTPAEQLSYDLARRKLLTEIDGERFFSLDPWRNDYLLVDQMNNRIAASLTVVEYMPARTVADYERIIAMVHEFPPVVDHGIAQLDAGLKRGITPPRVTLRRIPERLAASLKEEDPSKTPMVESFGKMPDTIPAAEQERLRRELAEAFRRDFFPPMHKLQEYLAKTYVPHARESIAVSDLPDGKAWYAWLLRYFTTTDLTPDQIHELGLSEVKRIHGQMEKVIASIGYKGTFEEFANFLRTDPRFFYTDAEAMLAGYRDIAKRIDPELPRLFGRLPRITYGVKAMEGHSESQPSALSDAGSLAAHRPGWMLVNTFDLKARPKWSMESLTSHEAMPGHLLQYAIVEEQTNLPPWRQWLVIPVFSEGWALYVETVGEELGLYKDPYQKFGQLNNEMWRAIRLVVDTGVHAKGWTRQQTADYCRKNSAKTDREIENEVDRYIVQPGSVPCYKLGEMKIRELRRYAEKTLGAKFDVRAFHDRILYDGQMPLDMLDARVRAWVAGQR